MPVVLEAPPSFEEIIQHGFGNLGKRHALQATAFGVEARVHDPFTQVDFSALKDFDPVDPSLGSKKTQLHKRIRQYDTLDCREMQDPRLAHFLARSALLGSLPETREGRITVLHDSVVDQSIEALSSRRGQYPYELGGFAIVHMLMNRYRKVLVASGSEEVYEDVPPGMYSKHADEVCEYFEHIGLSPEQRTVEEIDREGAEIQGTLATMIMKHMYPIRRLRSIGFAEPGSPMHSIGEIMDERALGVDKWNMSIMQSLVLNPFIHEEDIQGVDGRTFKGFYEDDHRNSLVVPQSAAELEIPGVHTDLDLLIHVENELMSISAGEMLFGIDRDIDKTHYMPSTDDYIKILEIIDNAYYDL